MRDKIFSQYFYKFFAPAKLRLQNTCKIYKLIANFSNLLFKTKGNLITTQIHFIYVEN